MLTREQFTVLVRSLPYSDQVFKSNILDNWAKIPQESANLEKLYVAYNAGNTAPLFNYMYVESGNNLQNPLWVNYKSDVYSVDLKYIALAIADEMTRKQQYTQDGGNNIQLISSIDAQITRLQTLFKEYSKDLSNETTT